MFAIVANADTPTLKTLSLVSRDHKHMAFTYLYRTWALNSKPLMDHRRNRLNLEKALAFISSDERLPYVRNLRIHIRGSLGEILLYDNSEDPMTQSMIASLFTLLRSPKLHLKFLEFSVYEHQALFLSHLGVSGEPGRSFVPFLSRFVLDLGLYVGPVEIPWFWRSHSDIRSLTLHINSPHFSLPSYTLPYLSQISLLHPQHSNIARGRPVTTVIQRNITQDQYATFADNLAASSVPVTRLDAYFSSTSHFRSPSDADNAYDHDHDHSPNNRNNNIQSQGTAYSIIARLPFLRFLKITQESMPPTRRSPEHVLPMSSLASLRHLETIEWSGLKGPDEKAQAHFFAACSKYCPALRRVTFHFWTGRGRTLEKRAPDADWEPAQYEM